MAAVRIPVGQREWITPAEQLDRVRERSPVLEQLNGVFHVTDVAKLALEYIEDPCIAAVSRALEALRKIGLLPAHIPALPKNMGQILNEKCPIHGDEAGPDGTSLKIWQTHSLYLLPPGTLNELEARVSAYGRAHLAEYGRENPLQFRYFWNAARQEHGDTRFDEPQWVLMSNDVLPGSRNQPYERHVEMVGELSEKAFVPFEVPSLRAAVGVTLLHKVATGESILQAGNEQNGNVHTYTRVGETTGSYHVAVGGSAPSGVGVSSDYGGDGEGIGVSALWKF
ncbi:MAG: hypothetical protein A3D96_06660 [Chlamydiae bacterium RIFCSPHIGHO2_12_FULL_44_59]|nr:MAG: hypothetical protein A2796_01805 [Chlamydiae bacterium RIFCSPHIGHO2_01_FULL_44_39]OGN59151.1 MAG: hypothetical protein A3C42_01865 [Chlamydiae bacterium RIFCSPHIGHO2_02_FULL_45_9]OGN59762.1 MAG: hypothetical protein A3D96_06660 [Chlamydiae bacterium RIFCSPHIGHO2_12_FULL_44_59]OGN65860.1 MAG: hypothetical protein A2978_05615 [Chlamydiae bacterium RIFCSPLOWO2_01_FULL_44_52]OGN68270.1 MAG: hypothetical protein A3I67_01735 [Chlamydiae bacterium RIFCSPLOWO2_02_FULL_45_22]OGN69580.1 MAG: hyp